MWPRPSKHAGSATSAALGTILSLAVCLSAGAAAPLETQETVRPGHPSLLLDRLQPGTDSLRVWRISGDDRRRGPLQIQSIERISRDGDELLRLASTLESERGNLYDTTTFRLPSLAPVRHISRPDPGGPWRTLEARYGDGIEDLRPLSGGDACVVLRNGGELRLSRTYREEFEARMTGETG